MFFGLSLFGCASTAQLPATLNIVPPSPDLPPEIAAFSGIWEGKWRGYTDVVLVVEKIDMQKAEIILSYGANYKHDSSYSYHTATISAGRAIEWTEPNGCKFIFEMDKGLNKINGFNIEKETGAKSWAYLHRRVVK
jgi:hypothetical protein